MLSRPTERRLRVAVIGAGPAGLYATRTLTESSNSVSIDVFDRLPAPYGLVRYGVAPDHPKMRSVTRVLRSSFDDNTNDVEFFGNVTLGRDLERQDLQAHYNAIIYATGAQSDRRLNIPGEELPGSYSAREFVSWYCGHPDMAHKSFALDGRSAVVIGAGNVALDVARMLAKDDAEVAATDVPDRVLEAMRASNMTDVHVVARRGPAHAKFTPVELREMGELRNADVIVRPDELVLDSDGQERVANNRQVRRNVEMLQEWSQRKPAGKPRRVHLRFLCSPSHIVGDTHASGIVLERNAALGGGHVTGTARYESLNAVLVLRSVGYQGTPLPGLPFDTASMTIPHNAGRLVDGDGVIARCEYVTGWVKRGPNGVIGTNKSDANDTVGKLLEDTPKLSTPTRCDRAHLTELLRARGVNYTTWTDWLRLDRHEAASGRAQGRDRAKLADLAAMLDVAFGSGAY